MQHVRPQILTAILAVAIPTLAPLAARAAEPVFPPVTTAERALTAVPGEPNAPAVVLFKRGEMQMAGYGLLGSVASHLRVQERVKILTAAGRGNGELVIAHGAGFRLRELAARTVLPDGRIVPVSADARFERRSSRAHETFVTTVAFPEVQPGAILDYQYDLAFSAAGVLDSWFFSDERPVLQAEITYKTSKGIGYRVWTRSADGIEIHQEKKEVSGGYELRAWAEGLPAVAAAPQGPPFAELATQIVLLPAAHIGFDEGYKLMSDWSNTTRFIQQSYNQVRARDGGVAKAARQIAGAGSLRQKAERLYGFVRDEVRTEPGSGVLLDDGAATLHQILAGRRGSGVGKTLLLQAMLRAEGIGAELIWAADRDRGSIDVKLPSPGWFDRTLVMIEPDFERLFLDPNLPALGFGQLPAQQDGAPAVSVETARLFHLPALPYAENLRRAEIDLALDAAGKLAGTGTLRLSGLRAVEKLGWKPDQAATAQAWEEWLAERYRDFKVAEVRVAEAPAERTVTVTWAMAQRQDELPGDESTLQPSAPLGPLRQPFVEEERKVDVVFDTPGRDEVELRLRWPAGWRLERAPAARPEAPLDAAGGSLAVEVAARPEERTLVYHRRFDLSRRRLLPGKEYAALRALFGAAAKSDAETVVLVRR
jgi:hypothetical protein